jgi:DNA polymerase-3 subunit gamma/tau
LAVSAADAPAAASIEPHASEPRGAVGGEATAATHVVNSDAPVSVRDAREPSPLQRMTDGPAPAVVDAPAARSGAAVTDAETGLQARAQTNERGAPAPDQAAAAPRVAPSRTGGASAALDVLRNAGMRVSTGRASGDRPGGAAARALPAAAPKPPAPRAPIVVPEPRPRAVPVAAPRTESPSAPPPWDDMPPLDARDDYVPLSSEDDYFSSPLPDAAFDGPMARSAAPRHAMPRTPAVDLSALPPPIPLDAIGFAGDWPALAVELGLTGIAHQLAFNSELTALDGQTLKLSVPVPQYADNAQVTKLKAALAERLGRAVEVVVEVGPASRTAATLDAAARAERQREAEREIDADPFVQSLIRDFGASIVPGSVKPLSPDTGAGAH